MSYEGEINRIMTISAQDFKTCERSDSALKIAIARYLALGRIATISQGELIDFLGVSSPSVLEMASYSEADQMHVMKLIGPLSDEEIDAQEREMA